ncbi:MAG: ORF6N domain-containing protein [Candidatus Margulisiibacteriota bacterium]
MNELVPLERIESKIYLIRGQKVMLDRDLAALYGVATKVLKQAVNRNLDRFPEDFMFELDRKEFDDWRSQFVTSNADRMGLRWRPYAFTEQGVAMLSSVLNSERAIQVNIQIMRAFVKFKQALFFHKELALKLDLLEERFGKRLDKHEREIGAIFEAIRKMLIVEERPKKRIGFI